MNLQDMSVYLKDDSTIRDIVIYLEGQTYVLNKDHIKVILKNLSLLGLAECIDRDVVKIEDGPKADQEEQLRTPSILKISFRENVLLTQEEYDFLLAKHGQEFFDSMLNTLDSYKSSRGKGYMSDFHTMKEGGWVVECVNKELSRSKPIKMEECV